MKGSISPKVTGAAIVGFALVGGAYVISGFGKTANTQQVANVTNTTPSVQRVAIEVSDRDGNGIEDWRDEFIIAEPLIIDHSNSTYEQPDTLTGQTSVELLKQLMEARIYSLGRTDQQIADNAVESLVEGTEQIFYGVDDVIVLNTWTNEDIVNYGNSMASIIQQYNNPDLNDAATILLDIVRNDNYERIPELEAVADVYKAYRDNSLLVPVPSFLAKEHIDLINTYEAMFIDADALAKLKDDPLASLLRLERYIDDVTGLDLALENMYSALEPHASLFTMEDPAVLFVIFSPDYQ